jgi:2-polyprenyl-3-methyl-5-hydroxy-6-metoxy-1,4-benzoquinol methylase
VITQNYPSEEEIGQYYDTADYVSHSDQQASFLDRIYYIVRARMTKKKQRWIERFVHGRTLIDVGAGTGFFIAHMRDKGWDVKGMEVSKAARQQAMKSHGLALSDPQALFQVPGESVDVVTLWHVLEHVHTPEKYLHRIHEILRSNGSLFVALPNYTSYDAQFYRSKWAAWDVPRHIWHFTPETIKSFVEKNGFALKHMYAMPFDAYYVSLMSEKYSGSSAFHLFRGLMIGVISNLYALFNKKKSSSLVYVFKKKN